MKKGILCITILLLSINCLFAAGTEPTGDPREVSTLDHLLWISTNSSSWGDDFIQTANIDASATSSWDGGAGWSPIGNATTQFTGTYNGQNYFIDQLSINRPTDYYHGFFGYTSGANIQNVGIKNISLIGGTSGEDSTYEGGLVGYNYNTSIMNCYSTGSITGRSKVGGLIGDSKGTSSISDCYSTATATGTFDVGGFIGRNYQGSISRCYSTGNVTGSNTVGGFAAWNYPGANISDCYCITSSVSGSAYTGGFAGYCTGYITNCYARAELTGSQKLYGFISGATADHITSCFWDVDNDGIAGSSSGDNNNGAIGKTTANMTTDALINNYTTNIYLAGGWDFKGETVNGTANIWNIGNERNDGYPYLDWQHPSDPATLPVELSTFTVQIIEGIPTLYWSTQSESDNLAWNIYRNDKEDFSSSELLTGEMLPGSGTTTEPSYYHYEDTSELEINQTYYYWLESIDYGGVSQVYSTVAQITIPDPSANPSHIESPIVYDCKNIPNPVKGSTHFQFTLDSASMVSVSIYNILGKHVRTTSSVLAQPDETSQIYWNGKDSKDNGLTPGVYFYNLIMNGRIQETKKLILMK